MKQTLALFAVTIGPQNDYVAEYFIRTASALQFIAGFCIVINRCKVGAQILGCTLVFFASTSYNPYFIGKSYENITLFVNELSLLGLCFILYAYENSQEAEVPEVKVDKKSLGAKMVDRNKKKSKTD